MPVANHTPRQQPPRLHRRAGFSLLELLSVISILGVLATLSLGLYRPETGGDIAAQTVARDLAFKLIEVRRQTIATGVNHLISFERNGPTATGYSVYRREGALLVEIGPAETFSEYLNVTTTAETCEFAFEGDSLGGITITFQGPNRQWQVVVIPSTGAVQVSEF